MRIEIIPEREAGGGLQGAGQAFLHAGAEKRFPQAAEAELALAPEGAAISGGFSFFLRPGWPLLRRRRQRSD